MQLSFTELSISRIFAGTMAVNTASRRVMEKSGLRLHRLHDCADTSIAGAQRGEVEYEILKSYWDANEFPWAWAARTTTDMIA